MIDRGYLCYLAFIHDTTIDSPFMKSIPMVREFMYVFPTRLPKVPPEKDN